MQSNGRTQQNNVQYLQYVWQDNYSMYYDSVDSQSCLTCTMPTPTIYIMMNLQLMLNP